MVKQTHMEEKRNYNSLEGAKKQAVMKRDS